MNLELLETVTGRLSGLLLTAYMVVLFTAYLFCPERIRSPRMFRWACSFFVFAIVLPMLIQMGMQVFELNGPANWVRRSGRYNGNGLGVTWLFLLPGFAQSVFFALSLMLALSAVAPTTPVKSRKAASPPTKHPLD